MSNDASGTLMQAQSPVSTEGALAHPRVTAETRARAPGRRLGGVSGLLLISTLIGCLMAAVDVWIERTCHVDALRETHEQVAQTYLSPLVHTLGHGYAHQTSSLLDSMVQNTDVHRVTLQSHLVSDESVGRLQGPVLHESSFDIRVHSEDRHDVYGRITVYSDNRLLSADQQTLVIDALYENIGKALLFAALGMIVYHLLVGRHLDRILARARNPVAEDRPMPLDTTLGFAPPPAIQALANGVDTAARALQTHQSAPAPAPAPAKPRSSELALVAHELYNPLASIEATATLMQLKRDECPPDLHPLITRIQANSHRCVQVIAIARELANGQHSDTDTVELVGWAGDFIARLEHPGDIRVDIEADVDVAEVTVNKTMLETIVRNLVENAVHATLAVGRRTPIRIRLSTRRDAAAEPTAQLDVIDAGCGLPEGGDRGPMDPFFTTKASGLGLGLSICRSLAEALRGQLTLIREPSGTRARLTLPLQRAN
ncbi:MAG: HAMP domain-containing sensor histidine kinase [Pseudomonadota bacterium]